ncbi:RND transporter, partial [Pseudomonas syringae]
MPRRIIRGLWPGGILAFTLVLHGCIGTHGIKPQGTVLHADSLATDQAIQGAAIDAHWHAAPPWRAYGPPPLARWVELAQRGSPSRAPAAARVRQASA